MTTDKVFRIFCRAYSGFGYEHKQGVHDAFSYYRSPEHIANGYGEADGCLNRIKCKASMQKDVEP